jgi:hypothetical protein
MEYNNLNGENNRPKSKRQVELDTLRGNMLLKLVSKVFGVAVPIVTLWGLYNFLMGPYSLSAQDDCLAVEYPNNNQFGKDMEADKYVGLTVVNVSERLRTIAWVGFVLEILILVCVVATSFVASSGGVRAFRGLLGYTSLGWFLYLLYTRYNHYGRVCTGQYLTAEEAKSTKF